MSIRNIAGYKFIPLSDLADLQASLLARCETLQLKGTVLLSAEGINLNLAGAEDKITDFKLFLKENSLFADMTFRESFSKDVPFDCLKIKIKNEIITFREPTVQAEKNSAPAISPHEFKHWLDENRDITVLDTRNDYEVRFGTFRNAVNLKIEDFSEFPKESAKISREKPIVMFCTGGIRCEKAALYLLQNGFENVYQLRGGILNYFSETGGAHFDGECFVFDKRIAVDANLQETGTQQCVKCEGPVINLQCDFCIAGEG